MSLHPTELYTYKAIPQCEHTARLTDKEHGDRILKNVLQVSTKPVGVLSLSHNENSCFNMETLFFVEKTSALSEYQLVKISVKNKTVKWKTQEQTTPFVVYRVNLCHLVSRGIKHFCSLI